LLNKVAEAFGVSEWPVAAIKSYVGHSLGAAAGDQLTATLGIWQHGMIPRIHTVDALADDVVTDRLNFALSEQDSSERDYALINSKGFGGNNATAALLSPHTTEQMLARAHGQDEIAAWRDRREAVAAAQAGTEAERIAGNWAPSYHFDEGVLTDADVTVTADSIAFAGQTIALNGGVPEGWQVD
jgi:acetoacetyl-[acyl-carrier protein] synthase